MYDYFRVSAVVPNVKVSDVRFNTDEICRSLERASENGSSIVVFPELSLTGCTCGDLFFQSLLLKSVGDGLEKITEAATKYDITAVIGAPLMIDGKLYDCGVVIANGRISGIVPKLYISAYGEASDKRTFTSAAELNCSEVDSRAIGVSCSDNYKIPVGSLIFDINHTARFALEIGDDAFAPVSSAAFAALSGAEVIINLAASIETVGMKLEREDAVRLASKKCVGGYVFVSSGSEESTSDTVFSGNSVIAENGSVIAVNDCIAASDYILVADIDLGKIKAVRMRSSLFNDASAMFSKESIRFVELSSESYGHTMGEYSKVSKLPFVPDEKAERVARCNDIFQIQVEGLKRRVKTTGGKLVVGISGGLDSTLALLVSAECMRQLGRPSDDVIGITMPCFGTSDRTFNNSLELMKTLGVESKTISIKNACLQHFDDIGHDPNVLDVTYENSQARERTQILMDYAGMVGGFVVGTGDLSELALGWCTYNGDHMSMYAVNCDVPKTLIRWIIDSLVESGKFDSSADVLRDILDTPISPELLPPDAKGKISQVTEDIVGPYALHDFFLFYTVRYGFEPEKIYHLAKRAFKNDFSNEVIKKWLKTFYKRFFTQQFKRNCVPDGVKVGSVALSPRGDWKMPSDASANLWLDAVDKL